LGRHLHARPRRLPRPQPRRPAGAAAGDLPWGRALLGREDAPGGRRRPPPRGGRRLAGGLRRSGSSLMLELGPLQHEELTALLAARAGAPPPAALTDQIVAPSAGNPLFGAVVLAPA